MTAGGPPRALIVAFIANEPGAAQKLLAEHIDDGTGHCKVCTSGAQAGRSIWPCWFHSVAEEASRQRLVDDARADRQSES